MKNALVLISAVALTACIAVPISQTAASKGTIAAADAAAPVCVIVQPDATSNGILYVNSGREVADKVIATLKTLGRNTVEVTMDSDVRAACENQQAELMLEPQILAFEDYNTGWTGRPDRIELRLTLSHLSHAYVERTADFKAESNTWLSAMIEWNNAKPTELLGKDFEKTLRKLLEQR
ncbi:hypothetical protein [Solimonas soli]|uniref:hypothetical protein n=1 Tax=Solimonas soli TaxID=413479 RepID=UPI000488C083|nr:hypothetical protein [Solimonas soli]